MKSILVVDDDPVLTAVIKNRLVAHNYQVTCASDGQEAIKLAKSIEPDLIIMDILMPKLSGGDAVKQLRIDEKTKHIPIFFLTAVTANMPQGSEGRQINIDGQFYPSLAKPFKTEKLLVEIRKHIGD